jgi:hypothetical protein
VQTLRNPYFLAMSMMTVVGSIGYLPFLTYVPDALSAVYRLGAGATGLLMPAMTLPVLIGPVLAARLLIAGWKLGPMSVIDTSLACSFAGTLGMLLLSAAVPATVIIAPMILLGLGFGLGIGLIDGEAVSALPPSASGTAAGVLNFFRSGSEALFLVGYAIAITALIGSRVTAPAAARATAAGLPGHPAAYAESFHIIVIALACLVTLSVVIIAALHRAYLRSGTTAT